MPTASDRADLAVKALRLGAYDYLTKPLDPDRLLAVVSAALESARQEEGRVGPYELGGEIGRGGMGVVYHARDATLGREAALKVLLPELAADRAYEEAFLKEARLLGGAEAPGVGVRAWCVARNGLGMETRFVSFNPPGACAVEMTRGPWPFRSFSGSWRFEPIAA